MRPSKRIDVFLNILKREWKKNPDLRFTQFLFNHGLVNTSEDYHIEESQLLHKMFPEIPTSEYLLWGTYGKNGTSKLKYKVIKDLDTDHIMSILATQNNIPKGVKRALIHVLKDRGYEVEFLKIEE